MDESSYIAATLSPDEKRLRRQATKMQKTEVVRILYGKHGLLNFLDSMFSSVSLKQRQDFNYYLSLKQNL